MREKNKAIILLLFILFSCQNKNKIPLENKKNVYEKNVKVETILIKDLNLDNQLDTLEIITKKKYKSRVRNKINPLARICNP